MDFRNILYAVFWVWLLQCQCVVFYRYVCYELHWHENGNIYSHTHRIKMDYQIVITHTHTQSNRLRPLPLAIRFVSLFYLFWLQFAVGYPNRFVDSNLSKHFRATRAGTRQNVGVCVCACISMSLCGFIYLINWFRCALRWIIIDGFNRSQIKIREKFVCYYYDCYYYYFV